jgi:hypothetical protein
LQIVVSPVVLFLGAIVLSIPLRYTDSDYLFDIFKLFLNNTTCLVQDQFIENVNRQNYFLSLPVLVFTDFKENDGKFTTASESLGEFMIINFNFMKVHVYLSQYILVSNDIEDFIIKIFTITSIAYDNLVLVMLFKTQTHRAARCVLRWRIGGLADHSG